MNEIATEECIRELQQAFTELEERVIRLEKDKKEYIYESPDGGKTVYRRELGDYENRELVEKPEVKNNANL